MPGPSKSTARSRARVGASRAGSWPCWCCLIAVLGAGREVAAGDHPLSCGAIADCADRCGSECRAGVRRVPCLLHCRRRCRTQGCAAARECFDGLTDCIVGRCFGACAGGPGAACRRCTDGRCAEQVRRCRQQRCPGREGRAELTWAVYQSDGPPGSPAELASAGTDERLAPEPAPPSAAPGRSAATVLAPTGALQPGQRGYKSSATASSVAVAATLLPIVAGGFLSRTQAPAGLWVGLGLIAAGQSFGPTSGFWYVGEPARFTWHRLAVSLAALGAAGYPFYAYGGRLDHYDGNLAGGLLAAAILLETAAILLAAWDLGALGEAVERHNSRPTVQAARPPLRGLAPRLMPVALPGGGGLGLAAWIR